MVAVSVSSVRGATTVDAPVDPRSGWVQPNGQSAGRLIFSDEFAAGALDTTKWLPSYPDTAFWNTTTPGGHLTNSGEPQAYDPSGITFAGSVMTFTIRNEVTVTGLPYTSGMVCSYPSFNQQYGFFEVRARLNNTSGMWPAFWLDPTNMDWPPEIDIMELWGTNPNVIRNARYTAATGWSQQETAIADATTWHTYALRWTASALTWYLDGTQTFTTSTGIPAQAMYIICNLAGDKDAFPASGSLPQSMDVDYIRAWSL